MLRTFLLRTYNTVLNIKHSFQHTKYETVLSQAITVKSLTTIEVIVRFLWLAILFSHLLHHLQPLNYLSV